MEKIMKNIFLIALITLLVISNISIYSEENISKVEIKTSSICEHCKENIENALNKVDGVKKSDLDLDTKIVTVDYDSTKTSPDEIRQTISKAGYNADDVKRDRKAYKNLPKCCKE
jgi:periplasmic mercuric ion binding protein